MSHYNQLCVLSGVFVGEENIQDFEDYFLSKGFRVSYETEVLTLPDRDGKGDPVPETGGRSDVFFWIHDEDIHSFALPRLHMGIRWWEDVIKYNDNSHLYTPEFLEKYPPKW